MTVKLHRALFVAGLLLLAGPAALAQEQQPVPAPRVELSGGYTYMRHQDSDSYPRGWYAAAGYNVNRWFGLVAEATRSSTGDTVEWNDSRTRRQVDTVMAGSRFFHLAGRGRIVPFVQVLAGAARTAGRFTAPPSFGGETWSSPRRTYFALQPGGGVTFLVTDRFGLRVAGDYRLLSEEHDSDNGVQNEFRFLAGATVQWLRR